MARIAGVELPKNKRIEIALTYLYGIGLSLSKKILQQTNINPDKRVKDLSDEEIKILSDTISSNYKVEGDLRKEVSANIKRLIDIGCYRGLRHKKGLPVRGQRTRTNARTRKGPRKTVGVVRKESLRKMGLLGKKKEKDESKSREEKK
jgi:small subunit ribosomal protein S13